jgi:hypothetical protein
MKLGAQVKIEIMTVCEALHEWANSLPALRFPFADATIPLNGIYVLFEHGELVDQI